jgi:hypothetical protein
MIFFVSKKCVTKNVCIKVHPAIDLMPLDALSKVQSNAYAAVFSVCCCGCKNMKCICAIQNGISLPMECCRPTCVSTEYEVLR